MLLTELRALEPVRSAVRDEDINQQDRNEQHDRLKVPVGARTHNLSALAHSRSKEK